ncbi:hypothetical protein D3C71_256550 [compost metagenome]
MTRRKQPQVSSMDSLVNGSMPAASIHVERDPSRGAARVSVNGRLVMEDLSGNFHPGRFGDWHLELAERHGVWVSPETFADVLLRALARLPEGCIITRGIYMSDLS